MRPVRVVTPGRGTLTLAKPVLIEQGHRYWVDGRASRLVVQDERGKQRAYPGEYRLGTREGMFLLRWSFIAASIMLPLLLLLAGAGGFPAREYATLPGIFAAFCWGVPSLAAALFVRRSEFLWALGLGTAAYLVTFPTALIYFPPYAVLLPLWTTAFIVLLLHQLVGRRASRSEAARG